MTTFELWCANDPPAYSRRPEMKEAWVAALNAAIEAMPGGASVDPQWVCDMLRALGGTLGSEE